MQDLVYCERGALSPELKRLACDKKIVLLHFPYEGHTKKITIGTPSLVTADATYLTADSSLRIDQMDPSEKFHAIRSIIGFQNEYDARHIDSAYKNHCVCFVTRDKKDILTKRHELENLLSLRFFHPDDDLTELLAFLDRGT